MRDVGRSMRDGRGLVTHCYSVIEQAAIESVVVEFVVVEFVVTELVVVDRK